MSKSEIIKNSFRNWDLKRTNFRFQPWIPKDFRLESLSFFFQKNDEKKLWISWIYKDYWLTLLLSRKPGLLENLIFWIKNEPKLDSKIFILY